MAKINYNGIELEEVIEPQIFDPPKKMVVWNYNEGHPVGVRELPVIAILPRLQTHLNILCKDGGLERWACSCAEIPEEPKPSRVTNRELSKWLAQGNGEVLTIMMYNGCPRETVTSEWHYFSGIEAEEVPYGLEKERCKGVRKWDDTEWHEPTKEYLGIESSR